MFWAYSGIGNAGEKGRLTPMGMMCLDIEGCRYQNRDKARFCAQCGVPLQGTLVQGRYEIQTLVGKDRTTVTLQGVDRHQGRVVTVRVMLPRQTTAEEQETFLQDAELALSLSQRVQDAGSIHVTDYGQDGPVVFLVKSEFNPGVDSSDPRSIKPHMTIRVEGNVFSPLTPLPVNPVAAAVPASQPSPVITIADRQQPVTGSQLPLAKQDWLARGNHAYEASQYQDALAAYEIAITQDVVSVEAWSGKGATLLHLGRPEESLLAYDHALSLYHNDSYLWHSRANVLHELGRFDEEMYCYDQALAYNPRYVFAWRRRGMTLAEQGRTEEALQAFDKALMLDPTQSVIWQAMSDTLYSIQRYDEALIAIDRALDIEKD